MLEEINIKRMLIDALRETCIPQHLLRGKRDAERRRFLDLAGTVIDNELPFDIGHLQKEDDVQEKMMAALALAYALIESENRNRKIFLESHIGEKTRKEIAREYGISTSWISRIITSTTSRAHEILSEWNHADIPKIIPKTHREMWLKTMHLLGLSDGKMNIEIL